MKGPFRLGRATVAAGRGACVGPCGSGLHVGQQVIRILHPWRCRHVSGTCERLPRTHLSDGMRRTAMCGGLYSPPSDWTVGPPASSCV